jgi:hypothetical protein
LLDRKWLNYLCRLLLAIAEHAYGTRLLDASEQDSFNRGKIR